VLHKAAAFVELDSELVVLIDSPAHRAILGQTWLETYFARAPFFGEEPRRKALFLGKKKAARGARLLKRWRG